MRILIVGKFPPIQGGVSARTYWAAREFGARGHDVVVVTDSLEVEKSHRQYFLPEDEAEMQRLSLTGVAVRYIEPLAPESHIPHDRASMTRLVGAGLNVSAAGDFDLVIGWYLEPYGVAAAVLAQVFGRPLLLLHAGSDIGRLAKNADCAAAYRWAFAQGIIATPRHLIPKLAALGARHVARLPPQRRLPPPFFERYPVSPIGDYTEVESSHFPGWRNTDPDALLDGKPVVSTYGKVGDVKGTFDLVTALSGLASKGYAFSLVIIASGTPAAIQRLVAHLLSFPVLATRTLLLPAVPPWRVPAMLQHADIVCFLERNFPIEFHAPIVPREVLASGACLVCSREIAAKQPYSDSLVHGKNYVEVADPQDIKALTAALRLLFDDPESRRDIARRGKFLSDAWEAELATLDPVVVIGERIAAGDPFA